MTQLDGVLSPPQIIHPRISLQLRLPDGGTLYLGPRTLVMGIVNVTPDSFSDGGSFLDPGAAVDQALRLEAEGADLVDIGGESTRPGAAVVTAAEERRRVEPVVGALSRRLRVPVSVDTTKVEVAAASLDAGASILNDVSMLRGGAGLAALAAERGAPLILMHSRATPATMAAAASYPAGVLAEVCRELAAALDAATAAGLDCGQILVDPGIGFAKTPAHSLEILARLPGLAVLERGIVVGVSRKSFIGSVLDRPVDERLPGTLAAEAAAVLGGAHILRTHDAARCRMLADLLDAVRAAGARP